MASVFTQIINREIPAEIEYEDERYIVIHDIAPQAKTHLLIIPKKEIPTINDITPEDTLLVWWLFQLAKKLANDLRVSQWYQLKFHVGKQGWQEVFHIHLHLTSDL